jgi:hypothetical protein
MTAESIEPFRAAYVCQQRHEVHAVELKPGQEKPDTATIRVRCPCGRTHKDVKPLIWRRRNERDKRAKGKIMN